MHVTSIEELHMGPTKFSYTNKQIYAKHKTIWWERVNASQSMTRNDFIRLQNIAYLDRKHKKGS